MRQTLQQVLAKVRLGCGSIFVCAILLSLLPVQAIAQADLHAEAKAQFDRAEQARSAVEARPEKNRSLKDYQSLVGLYRRVTLTTPRAAEVPGAINETAALYRAMGDLFDVKYYNQAIDTYLFLLHQYPTSRFREDALLAVAQIQKDDLHQLTQAHETYDEFLAQHPHSPRLWEVQAALADLNNREKAVAAQTAAPQAAVAQSSEHPSERLSDRPSDHPAARSPVPTASPAKIVVPDKTAPATDTQHGSATVDTPPDTSHPQVTRIRTWNADSYTRIIIDVGGMVKYQAARISGPDRIYFDLENARISSVLLHKPIEVGPGGFIKGIRVAQNQSGVVRVVLEVNRAKDYSVFLLPAPYRLVVDVYGTSAAAEEAALSRTPAPGPTEEVPEPPPAKVSSEIASTSIPDQPAESPVPKAEIQLTPKAVIARSTGIDSPPPLAPTTEAASALDASSGKPSSAKHGGVLTASVSPTEVEPGAVISSKRVKVATARSTRLYSPLPLPSSVGRVNLFPTLSPVPANVRVASARKTSEGAKSGKQQAAEMGPPSVPEPTLAGTRSLSRALGLKVGRIVIDAGHGGHDTGTIGPTGLMEKDLCLDVSLRLGKLIQQRLPNADVVYTRDDDTFVPLEQRTAMANQAHADLFLSIHANSSTDRSARGIETYYLNFTGSTNAMEVAARENATSENSVHDLQDIVAKIARNEKIEESRDLASIIQDSLATRTADADLNRGQRNRGVRKAPFVVLIGADMPSVLAEISFLSNPSDEQWLKKPENRQRIAEGLYRGIEKYLQSTNSLASNLKNTASIDHSLDHPIDHSNDPAIDH